MASVFASLVASHMRHNLPFTPGAGPNGGEFFLPWRALREAFAQQGVELNTPDRNTGQRVAFELHLNAQRQVPTDRPCYSFLYEDPMVRPLNADPQALARYRLLFTWNEELLGQARTLRLDYPNDLRPRPVPAWDGRDLFAVMIASNKALRHPDPRSLHAQRVSVIRHFEAHAPDLFTLYGPGWHIPAVRPGAWGRVAKRLNEWRARLIPGRPFPSWRGRVATKAEVLDRAKFCICFENSRGSPGYISEKIFDCLTSGCVPVYAGTTHATPPVPADCFISADRFSHWAEMVDHLRAIDAPRFALYQDAMRRFLASEGARRFDNAHFCLTLVAAITADRSAWAA
ncbi:Glycosyltransferase family 10 (fucosyltransferase) [Burkholderiales bacterium JOSHI_001]|nr:Glycosyltransferase family 10 (fucosyltransferase) [Burkholderiales bacterium JOSHI_001]